MKKDYYVYMYYDVNKEQDVNYDIIRLLNKPLYIGKGKGDRLNHSTKFIKDNIKVVKLFEKLSNRQAEFIESYLINEIGIENLENKKSGTNLYLLENLEDNDIFDYIEMLGSY